MAIYTEDDNNIHILQVSKEEAIMIVEKLVKLLTYGSGECPVILISNCQFRLAIGLCPDKEPPTEDEINEIGADFIFKPFKG